MEFTLGDLVVIIMIAAVGIAILIGQIRQTNLLEEISNKLDKKED